MNVKNKLDDDYINNFKDNNYTEKSLYTSWSAYRDKNICESNLPMRADSETDNYSIKFILQNGVCSK